MIDRQFVCSYRNPTGTGFIVEIGNPPGRWMQAKRPTQYLLRCDGGGCQHLTQRGDWYWRESPGFLLCESCATGCTLTTVRGGQRISYEVPPRPTG